MNLTELIIKSGLTANRVYCMIAKLKIKPINGFYPKDTIDKILTEHKSCNDFNCKEHTR